MRKLYETAVILIATLGWWGFVYPDMCLTQDVYEKEQEDQEEVHKLEKKPVKDGIHGEDESEEDTDAKDSGWKIGNIRIKSRILEYVYQER